MTEGNMWVVRAGEKGRLIDEFQKKNVVAIGWTELADLKGISSPTEVKQLYKKAYPNEKPGQINIGAGQMMRFRFDFKLGDWVITYNPETRKYLVGEIKGNYEYNPNLLEYHHTRGVEWRGEVERDKLSTATKNTLGAISTIFEVRGEAKKEIIEVLKGKPIQEKEADKTADEIKLKEDLEGSALEFIKDKIKELSWEEAQELVAGILRAMGYKTRVSPPGPDLGKDIVASKDGLGLEGSKVIVEIKHRTGQMDSDKITAFIGKLRKEQNQKGIYVSTGGFTRDAKREAERSNNPLTLVDLDYLVELITQNYDNFDTETRILLPLTKIYWPETK